MEDFAIGFCFFRKNDLYQSWNCFHGRSEEDNTEYRRRHYCSVCRDHDGTPSSVLHARLSTRHHDSNESPHWKVDKLTWGH